MSKNIKNFVGISLFPQKVGGRNSSNFTVAYVSFKWVVKKKALPQLWRWARKKSKQIANLTRCRKNAGTKIMAKKNKMSLKKSRLLAKFDPQLGTLFQTLQPAVAL